MAEAEDHDGIVDAVILPPWYPNGYAMDEEEGDDDIGLAGNLNLPNDVAGEIELMYDNSDNEIDSDDEAVALIPIGGIALGFLYQWKLKK